MNKSSNCCNKVPYLEGDTASEGENKVVGTFSKQAILLQQLEELTHSFLTAITFLYLSNLFVYSIKSLILVVF